jgi:diaminopropionate ammonia-lyase
MMAESREGRVRFHRNPHRLAALPAGLLPPVDPGIRDFHRGLPGYRATPLLAFPALARDLGLGQVWVKDEGHRLGLPAFKVLGAAYAVHRLVSARPPGATPLTLATATDGNHGRAVAWAARALGQRAVIYLPAHSAPARLAAIRSEGAEVVEVDGTYDEAVARAAADAQAHGYQVVADTAYPGYTEIPEWIVAGYETIFAEAAEGLAAAGADGAPDVVALQAGVGGLAAAGARFFARRAQEAGRARPRLLVVEPTDADCLLASIASPDGERVEGPGLQRSIMAGLNCGIPSLTAWPVLRAAADAFLAVDDGFAEEAMRRLAGGAGGDPHVVAGESGAAGLAGLLALAREPALASLRSTLGVGPGTSVLLVVTEGATDPEGYRRVVEGVW